MHAWVWSTLVAGITLALPTADATLAGMVTKRDANCTFSGASGYQTLSQTKASCSTIVLSALSVPPGVTLDLTGIKPNTTVIFQGETTFGYKEWTGPLFSISGTNINITGAANSSLNGNGASYWDGQGGNGGKTKPKFFSAHNLINSTISGIRVVNAPVQVFSINSVNGLNMTDIVVDNKLGDTGGGHNTDAFDIGRSDKVIISNAKVYNQDDCVAVNSGTNILFTGGYCFGGHGLSIGSVGGRSDNTVANVTFENSEVVNSQQAIRIKTISGATGAVSNITYRNITISGATKYGIVVDQAYNGAAGQPTNGVPIQGFVLANITGTVKSSATNIYIDCGTGSCAGWAWSNVTVTGGKKSASCKNVPGGTAC